MSAAAALGARFGHWSRNHWPWLGLCIAVGWFLQAFASSSLGWWPLLGTVVGLVAAGVWSVRWPVSYDRWVAGPLRRHGWRRHVKRRWPQIAEVCGLTGYAPVKSQPRRGQRTPPERVVVAPRLRQVRAHGYTLEISIRARAGQTVEELEMAAPRLASTLAAVSHTTRPVTGSASGCCLRVELVMADALTAASTAREPDPVAICESVRLGRRQAGMDWSLQLRGRHTLVAGCSGAGKGSVLWGICCGLAPAVRADVVRLWGVDLKRGVELAMGSGLFSAHAYTPTDALAVLKKLMAVIDERGAQMAGATRLHQPVVGDPLHVLVVDELAALTAYAEVSIRREAERLLSEILTQGRALGVVVVACVQDPRKDVVTMRGLFTQTIALRLRSVEETSMVLGDGMTRTAPAHRISPTHPGTAWVVGDDGSADRVRADFWPDHLIREVATRFATLVEVDLAVETGPEEDEPIAAGATEPRQRRPRSPRSTTRGQRGAA